MRSMMMAGAWPPPAHMVTSVCFAGDDRRDLVVVSADNTADPVLGGCLFRTRVDATGAPVPPATV